VTTSPLLLFEFADATGRPQTLRFTDPTELLVAHRHEEVVPVLRRVQAAVDAGAYAAGYVAYEAAPAFDPAFCVREGCSIPLAWFGLFPEVQTEPSLPEQGDFQLSAWETTTSREQYRANIAAIHKAIAEGETYQVNYTLRAQAQFAGDATAFYRRLCRAQRADYCAFFDLGRFRILSASPELFFRRSGRQIVTRPMKGTIRRGRWNEEDAAQAARLAASEKERAENLMIVDLLRSDLGRIAEVGSVEVARLFETERYPTLWQMTSTVRATLPPETTLETVFRALFPCGSITGAPKISTMRRIAALEQTPRQVYCGAMGYVTPQQEAVFNVAIRTVLLDSVTGRAEYGVGGGITWDSTPEDEYEEALTKAAIVLKEWPRFDLLETLRLEEGTYALLERHLQRLADSAAYFAIPLSPDALRERLADQAQDAPAGTWRGRLLVSQAGEIHLECRPLEAWPPAPLPVALAPTPVSSQDPFLFHKTTHRALYETRRAERPDVFDVLLVNERGELTEFTLGNLVVEIAGQRWTPPRACGVLAGTLRAELLERGEIGEQVLTPTDLTAASGLWLINSVRGWVPVCLREVTLS
jgi:para-aminobenzoate synthetase/4-amino-4-deoxychorismate lyase